MSWQVVVAAFVVAATLVLANGAARRTGIPYPVFLVVAGVVSSQLPGVHIPELQPNLVFFGFLPPLVYAAAFLASPSEFAANWVPIGLLAVGLVLATTAAVAVVGHALIGRLGFAPAFALGAIVAPTDPVAAGAVIRRVGAPRQIITILEGESLINDGVALALYSLAVSATVSGGVTVLGGTGQLLRLIAIAIGVGLAVGAAARSVRRRVGGGDAQVVLSLVTPYVAYLSSDLLGASGVLATVTAGLLVGWRTEGLVAAPARLRTTTFWDVLVYLLNAVLFLLLGARFDSVVRAVHGVGAVRIGVDAAATVGVVVLLRLGWALVVPRLVAQVRVWRQQDIPPRDRHERLLVGWSGMRGAISLAAALSIPLDAGHGAFPGRALIILVTFCVILATLVVQGATLPLVIRWLGLAGAGGPAGEEARARARMAEAALDRLDELTARLERLAPTDLPDAPPVLSPPDLAPLRQLYEQRLERASEEAERYEEEGGRSPTFQRERLDAAWREAIGAAREELHRLERGGEIDNETMLRLQRELDLEETRRHR